MPGEPLAIENSETKSIDGKANLVYSCVTHKIGHKNDAVHGNY